MNIEKRKVARFPLSINAVVTVDGLERGMITSDVSSNGVFFETASPFSQGTDVNLEIFVPTRKGLPSQTNCLIKANGNIVRTNGNGMAIRFTQKCELSSCSTEDYFFVAQPKM